MYLAGMNAIAITCDIKALLAGIKPLFVDPQGCWNRIAAENRPPLELKKKLVLPLSILGALSLFLSHFFWGISDRDLGVMYPNVTALLPVIIMSVFEPLVRIQLAALVLQKFASFFGGSPHFNSVFALAAYSSVPGLLGAVLRIIPDGGAALFWVFSIFGLYVFYCGVPLMTQVPLQKRVGFFISSVGATIALQYCAELILSGFYPSPASLIAP
jgi:hypothetical protein